MESLLGSTSTASGSISLYAGSVDKANHQADYLVLSASFSYQESSQDTVSVNFGDLYKGLSLSASEIIEKLNGMLKAKLPNGIQSLQPQDVTPEATAERIVNGVTAFFSAFAKQHPELEGADLLSEFMEQVRCGVAQGYDEAFSILEGLGAFQYDGVQSGIEKTKRLIEEKLAAYENFKRQEMGLTSPDPAVPVKDEILAQGGAGVMAANTESDR